MNGLQDLIEKLKKIDEAEVPPVAAPGSTSNAFPNTTNGVGSVLNPPAAPAPAAGAETMDQVVDRREKAAAAKQILKTMVKKKRDLDMVNGYYIEAETGALLHSMIANRSMGGQPAGTVVTTRDISFGQGKEFADQLTGIGLKITPETVTNPGIFGWKWTESTKTILKINLKDLETIAAGKPPTQAPPPPAVPAANAPAANAPAANAPAANAPAANAPAAAANPEMQKKIDRLKTILKLNVTKESIVFKSKIGRLLLEEFNVLEAPVDDAAQKMARNASGTVQVGEREELDTLWKEVSDAMNLPGALTPEQRKEVENMTQAVTNYRSANPLPVAGTVSSTSNGAGTGTSNGAGTASGQSVSSTVQALATANNITDPNKIKVGQKITLPDGKVYTVVQGDTLSAIQAGKYKGAAPVAPAANAPAAAAPAAAAPAAAAPAAAAPAPAGRVPRQPTLNGKPSTGPKGQAWLKKYGATHNPDGTPKSGSDQKVAPAANAVPAADATGTLKLDASGKPVELPEILKTFKPTNPDSEVWINGMLFDWNPEIPSRGPHSPGRPGSWEISIWPGKLTTYNNRQKVDSKYTSPGWEKYAANMKLGAPQATKESVGFANEELNRIVSLVHHR